MLGIDRQAARYTWTAAAILLLLAAVYLIRTTQIVDQAQSLIERLNVTGKASEPAPIIGEPTVVDRILGGVQFQIRQHSADIVSFLPRAGLKALSIAGDLIWVVIVPILSFFFLKDGRVMRETILGLLVEDLVKDMDVLLAQYMRALLVLSLFTLVFVSFYLSVTRVPYALLLAAIA